MNEDIYSYTEHKYRRYPGRVSVQRCENGDFKLAVCSSENVSAGSFRMSEQRFDEFVDTLRVEQGRRRAARGPM